jgi:hypothetical protein
VAQSRIPEIFINGAQKFLENDIRNVGLGRLSILNVTAESRQRPGIIFRRKPLKYSVSGMVGRIG